VDIQYLVADNGLCSLHLPLKKSVAEPYHFYVVSAASKYFDGYASDTTLKASQKFSEEQKLTKVLNDLNCRNSEC
jgi:hypothetical protein